MIIFQIQMSKQQESPTAIYQHMCLHNALRVNVTRKEGFTQFLDVDHVQTNLFEKESHSDRLLDHYLSASHQKELAQASEEGTRPAHCMCEDYANYLRTEYLHGELPPPGSMRESLTRRLVR
jgi:hypothetical protein